MHCRYNLVPVIAKACGWQTQGDQLWRDKVQVEVAVAVMHSFREDGLGNSSLKALLALRVGKH